MGYETYLVEVRFKNHSIEDFITDLQKLNFTLMRDENNLYLEKIYTYGIIEMCISDYSITFRYAKPNLPESLSEFLEELQLMSKKYKIELFDFHTKQTYTEENFLDIIKTFEKNRKEFLNYFPDKNFPIRSNDVFGKKK